MQVFLGIGFILLNSLLLSKVASQTSTGAPSPIGPDEENYNDVLTMIKTTLENKVKDDPCYIIPVTLNNVKMTRQVVAGFMYNVEFTEKKEYCCINDPPSNCLCETKPPEELPCTASLWKKLPGEGGDLVYDKEPDCK